VGGLNSQCNLLYGDSNREEHKNVEHNSVWLGWLVGLLTFEALRLIDGKVSQTNLTFKLNQTEVELRNS
jgi:hypothetical protein